MKILIIGGTGVLSYDFTQKVINCGHEVYLLNRGKTSLDFMDKCKFISADIRQDEIEVLKRKLSVGIYDVVVDFLSYDSVQVEKTLKVLENCYTKYVFISTALVYGEGQKKQKIDENTQVKRGIWEYADKKIDAENYVVDKVKDYLIIRPYITYGNSRIPYQMAPDKYYYTLIKRIIDERPIPLLEGGGALCNLTHTIDFANILYRLIVSENAHREIYNVVSDDVVSWKEIYDTICSQLNVCPNLFSLSYEEVKKYLPEYYYSLKCGKGEEYVVSGKKAENEIGGYQCSVTKEEGISKSLKYYLDNPEHQGVDYRWDGRMDYAYRRSKHKICKLVPTKGNKDKSTNLFAYYFMQSILLRKIYRLLKRSIYE